MMRAKAKQQEAPAPRYVPTGLLKPNLDEIRNGYDAERLTETMRVGCVSEMEFALIRLVRAEDRRTRAAKALVEFHALAYPRNGKFLATLTRLQVEQAEAAAEYEYACALRDIAEESAR